MTDGLAVEGLTFAYGGGPPVVADVDLQVNGGEILSVVGPSGSGKTTLLRLIAGLVTPSAGRILVGGTDVAGVPPERRPVALVFQGFALFPHLDVAANIGFGLRVRRVSREDRVARVREVAELLAITPLLARRPGELSGGERQRVALARALVRDPLAFLLDEPLSGLDPVLRTTARRDLEVLLRQEGRCALYVTHDQAEAVMLADRVAVIREGRIDQVGTPTELYEKPATRFVASFVGTPPMALMPVGTAGLRGPAGAVTLGVRAEHVRLVRGDLATVLRVDDLGHERIADLELDGQVLVARVPRSRRLVPGQRTGVEIAPQHLRAFDASGRALQ